MRATETALRFQLGHGEILRLEDARGCTVRCEDGALMLSGPPPMGDVELRAGGEYRVAAGGLVLLEGWRGARGWIGTQPA